MKKNYPVITISRQYAAYGRTIARRLSEHLGIPFYDGDDLKRIIAQKSGYSLEDVKKEGEEMSFASRIVNGLFGSATSNPSLHDEIFDAQSKVILELAKEPCIIVGRCADFVLGEVDLDLFSVFLYADLDKRILRAAQLQENKGLDPKKIVAKKDSARKIYYKKYTGHEMGQCENYNICLDVGSIGVDKCVDVLCSIVNARQ